MEMVHHLHRLQHRHTAIHRILGNIILQAHRLSSGSMTLIQDLHLIIHMPRDATFAIEAAIIVRLRSQRFPMLALSVDHHHLAPRS